MRSVFLYALLVVLTVSSVSCGRKGKVIPRGEMAEIYAEMFVLDYKVSSDYKIDRTTDTLLVYESVFKEHGYTSDDYRRSMEHYIKDPDRYARILKESVLILEARLKELKSEKALLESISQSRAASESFRPEKIFFLSGLANKDLLTVDSLAFYIDSTGGGSYAFDVQKGYDTLYIGPRIDILSDTLSLSVPADSTLDRPSAAEPSSVRAEERESQVKDGRIPAKLMNKKLHTL